MNKEIVISVSSTETRIAILEDQQLVEIYLERPENARMVGDVYLGKVENVVRAIQAAFVNVGLEKNGFLPFADIGAKVGEYSGFSETILEFNSKFNAQKKSQISENIKEDKEILIQVTKEPIGSKGPRFTTQVSLPGRFIVLVPHDHYIGVSRKISDQKERRRLRMLAKSLCPEGFGLIMRTVATGKDAQTIIADLDGLMKKWQKISEKARKSKAPTLVYKDVDMASSVIRDLFSPDIDKLVIDNKPLHRRIKKYIDEVAPQLSSKLSLYTRKQPLFDNFGIEQEIEKSLSRKIWLKSGGHIIFDHTEAMVVVDVNSGKSVSHKNQEANALKTDLEAAKEIARQLRLRDIGGIIVIDFIDLRDHKNRDKVFNIMKTELKKDRAAFDILPLSDFGLLELTRERIRPSLLYRYSEPCSRCDGLGRIPARSSIMTQLERQIRQIKYEEKKQRLRLRVNPELEEYLTEGLFSRVRNLMVKHLVTIAIESDTSLSDEGFVLSAIDSDKKG